MTRSRFTLGSALTVFTLSFVTSLQATDWAQFRGPGGLGSSIDGGLPSQWSSVDNVVWQTELPGPGGSSPIVVGDRVFVTCYTGYGLSVSDPGDQSDLRRHVICLDRSTGSLIWKKHFEAALPESEYRSGNDGHHGYATSTPVSDGERLYVFFGKSGVYALDLAGTELWHRAVGDNTRGWGSGASPILYEELLIVNASVESGRMLAFHKRTGELAWEVEGMKGVWGTPLLVENPQGKTELVVSHPQRVQAYDPANGSKLWHCEGIPDRGYVCPSPIAHQGVIYLIGGRQNTAIAIQSGGMGDVTDSHVRWRVGKGSNVSSPVYHDGHIYWFHEKLGTVICLNAETGEVAFQERLSPRPGLVYASTTVGDGKLYAMSQYNGAFVIKAAPEFEMLAHNEFSEDDSRSNASPVVHDGQLILRTDRRIYCVGQP